MTLLQVRLDVSGRSPFSRPGVDLANLAVKTLDGEMKTLVYENYSKFITATDTIRTVRWVGSRSTGDPVTSILVRRDR